MKRLFWLRSIILIAMIILAVFSFASCNKNRITAPENITMISDGYELPEIKLDGKVCDYTHFQFENLDGFIYVYDGRICFTDDAPDAFSTTLTIYHKNDKEITYAITVVRQKSQLSAIEISCNSKVVFPGERVDFDILTQPSGTSLKELEMWVDKPQYVDQLTKDGMTLTADTPLGEKIKLTVSLSGVATQYEFSVADRIFEITRPDQLELTKSFPHGYFRLAANIDMSGYEWSPTPCFYGFFDGNGYTISNIHIDRTTTNSHAFLFLENFGIIRNLRITDSSSDYASASTVSPYHQIEDTVLMAGVVCGPNHGSIENVVVENCDMKKLTVGDIGLQHNYMILSGGICGINYGRISKCGSVNNKITAYAASAYQRAHIAIGGIAGNNDVLLEYSYSYNNEFSANCYGIYSPFGGETRLYSRQGGIASQNCGNIYECVAGNNSFNSHMEGVTEKWEQICYGGLLSYLDDGNIDNCYILYSGHHGIGNQKANLVTQVSNLDFASCKNLHQDMWISVEGRLIIKYDWRYSDYE